MPGLLLDPVALRARAALAAPGGPFAALAASLAADVDRVITAGVHVADRKARLTRVGGRCPVHGSEFRFDPFSPDRFHCPACGRDYAGREHEQFWLYRYQLWLAERAVHAAALHALLGRAEHAAFAGRVLAEAADVYPRLPNRDNVLGPTRPFFSTYLESLWLLALCVALDLLESSGAADPALGGRVRDQLVAPSRALVASYPEGRSNRQVWNAAARLAASRLLGDAAGADDAAHGADGVAAALADGLLADGTWYEGDNYHQFAHRGLWYGVAVAERAGSALDAALVARFDTGFAPPFLVALPDDTLPARRDSQYAASLRQWRWAEWCEIGRARALPDQRRALLDGALGRLYGPGAPAGDTGRWRASGEAERNELPVALSRADLGWKSLLFADPAPPAAAGAPAARAPASVLLPAQGLAVLRGDAGQLYAALDYGAPGGGHGHPDRLNVILQDGPARWLDDPGTGSYVERTLHWYRSTLAHAAPLADGRSQPRSAGALGGYDDAHAAVGVVGAQATAHVAPGVVAVRTLVLAGDTLVDRLEWRAGHAVVLDLPLPVGGDLLDVEAQAAAWRPTERPGAGGLEDGFDFLTDVEAVDAPSHAWRLRAQRDEARADLWVRATVPVAPWRARAPAPPGRPGPARLHVIRAEAARGALVCVWSLRGAVARVDVGGDGAVTVTHADGGSDVHRPARAGDAAWRVERRDAAGQAAAFTLRLPVVGVPAPDAPATSPAPATPPRGARAAPPPAWGVPAGGPPLAFVLGRAHYRRSEASWEEAGRPTATVAFAAVRGALDVIVTVRLGRPPVFVPRGADNPLDNERAGINGDGVQLYLGPAAPDGARTADGWLLVPEPPGPRVRVARVTVRGPGAARVPDPTASWQPTPDGYELRCRVRTAALARGARAAGSGAPALLVDVLVNEMPAGRERRRGQLVLSGTGQGGAGDAFVYLRGDRHDPARGVVLRLPPAP